jgi:hypothetical protein
MRSSPAMSQGPTPQGTKDSQDNAMGENTSSTEDGVCIRKMRRMCTCVTNHAVFVTDQASVYSQSSLHIRRPK